MIHYIFLVAALIVTFFILHSLSKDDFVLIRKNISVFQMFDLGLLSLGISFIFGRLMYVADTRNIEIVHILRFFYIIKFAGFSFLGALIGFNIGIFLLFRGKSAFRRMFDMYSISFSPVFMVALFLIPDSHYKNLVILLGAPILIVCFLVFLKVHKDYKLRDGSISAITLLFAGVFCLYASVLSNSPRIIWDLSLSALGSICIVFASCIFFMFNERHLLKIKHGK